MKLAVLSTASAAAFAPSPNSAARSSTSALSMAEPEKSQALPFAPRPKLLDGTLPGDVGFDPFGFAGDDKASLMNQREAEIKHGEPVARRSRHEKQDDDICAGFDWGPSFVPNSQFGKTFCHTHLVEDLFGRIPSRSCLVSAKRYRWA